jgi:cytochrome c-type biogenesis protein CcmH/NrfG
MNTETKQLLSRWQLLEKDSGLQHAASRARALWFTGLVLCIFVVFAVIYRLHPAFVAVAAAAMGWVTAESNALRTRLAQWPIFKTYIDWKRVEEDLRG